MWKLSVIFLLFGIHSVVRCEDTVSYRLSNTTEPVGYELWINTNIHNGDFEYSGRVRITIHALANTDEIQLNSVGLLIYNAYITEEGLVNAQRKSFNVNEYTENDQIIRLPLVEPLVSGRHYNLFLHFTGQLQNQAKGFFYNRYVDDFGRTFYVATTHFQHIFARWAFPCYDEPRFRTPFIVHISHGEGYWALSNMPVAGIDDHENGTVTTNFEQSVSMSVNVVAFTVSNFVSRGLIGPNNVPVTVWTPVHSIDQVEFGLNRLIDTMVALENYTGHQYSLPKLDNIVISDFVHITMENWGLMTFDSKFFLHQEGVTNLAQTIDVVKMVTHTLAHNFFGNLVGIPWWNYVWMTEGFATYFEYFLADEYFPELHMSDLFVVIFMHRILYDDSLPTTRAMSVYRENVFDLDDVFDGVALRKGSAIIRMLDNMIGKETFRKGVNYFLEEMAYKVSEPADLYRNLQKAVTEDDALPNDLTVQDLMYPWEHIAGYPLITVMRNYQANQIVVNQRKFKFQNTDDDPECSCWNVPLSMATANYPNMENTKPSVWMRSGVKEIVLSPLISVNKTWTSEEWVLFNVQQTGYYRVNYDTQNWRMLATELHQGPPFNIDTLNRAQLIDDSFNLAYSDIVEFPIALDIIKYIREEPEFPVWTAANKHLESLNRRLQGPSYDYYFGRFLRHLTEDLFDKVDVFENLDATESARITFLRPIIVDLACRSGSGKCLTATRVLVMAEALTGHRLVPHEKSSVYYCHGLKNANWQTFFYFWQRLHSLRNDQERHHLVNSLSCYQSASSVADLLGTTVDLETTGLEYTQLERFMVLATAFRNGHLRLVMVFLKENHEAIAKTYTFNSHMIEALREMTSFLQSEEDIAAFDEMLQVFFEAGHIGSLQMAGIRQEIEHNQKWVDQHQDSIEQWILNFFEPAQSSSSIKYVSLTALLFSLLLKAYL
ncbi:hypothetical protein DMENIID0001_134760 [Sergentomyia squamirostris]